MKKRALAATLGKHDSRVRGVAFAPGSKLLASGSFDTTAKLWDVATRRELAQLATCECRPVSAVAYAPDGKTVAIGTDEPAITLYDAATGKKKSTLSGHADAVHCLAYAPDGLTLASGSKDGTVRLWDPATGALKRVLDKHTGPVHAVAFAPDGKRLATAGEDATVNVWDPGAGTLVKAYKEDTGPVHALAFAPRGGPLAAGGASGAILLWPDDPSAGPRKRQGHGPAVRALAFAGDTLVSGSDDGTIQVWEGVDGGAANRKLSTRMVHAGGVRALAYLDGTDEYVSGGANGDIMQWDLATGAARSALLGHRGNAVTALAIHPGGEELLSGSLDGQVLRWPAQRAGALPGQPVPRNSPPPPPPELKEFYHDFRDGKPPEGLLAVFGPGADRVTHPEARGLHIQVEANPGQTQRIGVLLPARFRGDFEVTAGYEILRADQPQEGHGVGVNLLVDLDSPAAEVLEVLRFARVQEGQVYGCVRKTVAGGKQEYQQQWFPTESKAGQLRLTRKGAEVIWSAREEGQQDFHELNRLSCGTEDVKLVRFAAYMGFAQNSVDIILRDLRVAPPGAGGASAAGAPVPGAERFDAPTRGRSHLALLGLLLLPALVVVFLVLFVTRRKRRAAQARAQKPAAPAAEAAPAGVVCTCPQCGKRLRAPNTLVGKQVNCPQCGGQVAIPKSGASGPPAAR